MTENKVAAPVKTEAGSPEPEPTGQSSSKKSYNQRRNARRNQAKKNTGGYAGTGTPRTKFIGRTDAIKDHIFAMGTGSGALFSKSKKELLLHFAVKNQHVVTSIEQGAPIELVEPEAPQVHNPDYDIGDNHIDAEPEYIDKPLEDLSYVQRTILKEDVSHYVRSKHKLVTDLQWAYSILKGQCTDELIVKLETHDTYEKVNKDRNVIELLSLIQRVCFNYQNDEMAIVSCLRSLQTLYGMKQQKNELMTDYSNRFTEQLEMVEACNGSIPISDGVKDYISNKEYKQEYHTLTAIQQSNIELTMKNYMEATLFLMTAGGNATLVRKELNNEYIRGNDNYPSDITSARAYIVNYDSSTVTTSNQHQPPPPQRNQHNDDDPTQEGMLLAQNGSKAPIDMSTITCRHPDCGQTGHFQNSTACPIRQKEMAKAAEFDKLQLTANAIKKKTGKEESEKTTATNLFMQGVLEGSSDILMGSMMCQSGSLVDEFVKHSNDEGQREDSVWNHKGIQSTHYSSNVLSQGQDQPQLVSPRQSVNG